MRIIHFRYPRPSPFAIALCGTTIDDFGNMVHLESDVQWFAAARFVDDNYFDDSLGFDGRGWSERCT
jgi:hypothetical protein